MHGAGNPKAIYTGEVSGLKAIRHGKGSFQYPYCGGNMFQFSGQWKDGHKSNGKFSLRSYMEHEGQFKDGEIEGEGTRKWQNGQTYTGAWREGEMEGKGIWTNANGDEVYEGDFSSNKRQGEGVLTKTYASNGSVHIYRGSFNSHKFCGHGVYLIENSVLLEGTFTDGVVNGPCSVTWSKLASFDGNFVHGIMEGNGYFGALNG